MNFSGSGLESLWLQKKGKSRAVSGENLSGEKGNAGKTASNLGPTRKGSNGILHIAPGETTVLAEIEGPGIIRHFFITLADRTEKDYYVLRDLILRIYWEEEEQPSVESPLGDFFCCGFGRICEVNSIPVITVPARSMHCYFPMPFKKKAKITIENQHAAEIPGYFFQVDYEIDSEISDDISYFHAQWRRTDKNDWCNEQVVLNRVQGSGQYIGTYAACTILERSGSEQMELEFCVDGRALFIRAMGLSHRSREDHTVFHRHHRNDTPTECGFYDWYILNPVLFEKEIRVTAQMSSSAEKKKIQSDICSVAYWYQAEPHNPFEPIPAKEQRWPL